MRILITGMNKLQCTRDGYLNQQLQVAPSHYALIRCLEDMGHTVDQRSVSIGESLDEYDEVIVFLHNPAGFAGFLYNGLYTIATRPNCILAFDDWQTESIYKGLLALEDEDKLFREYILGQHKDIPENIKDYLIPLSAGINQIESKTNRMLLSAFSGGDLSLLIDYPKELLFGYNPNPYHLNRKPASSLFQTEKRREFNFAGLVQDKTKKWLKKQNIGNWKLNLYGSRKDGQDRVKEQDIVTIFSEQWGILMAGYMHAGSGWWRARPLQVADADSILIGEPKEMMLYYKDESLANLTAFDLLNKTEIQLEDIAKAQREALYKNHPLDKFVTQSELKSILESK